MGSSVGKVLGAAAGIGLGIASGGTSWAFSPVLGALGGSILGGSYDAGQAAKDAANQQAAATGQANQALTGMYQQNYTNLAPWMGLGTQAGNQLGYMLGLQGYSNPMSGVNTGMGAYGSLSSPFSLSQFNQDPGYAFRMQQGIQALDRSAAAKGMTLSGAQQKALTAYGQGMGSQEYQNAFNRDLTQKQSLYNMLSGTSQQGMAAGSALAGVGQNTANQISGNLMNLGAGQSALTTSGNAAQQSGLNQLGNLWMNWNAMQNQGGGASNPWLTAASSQPSAYNSWLNSGGGGNYMNLGGGLNTAGAGGYTGRLW